MPIQRFTAENFRCLEKIELDVHPHFNLIHGANASGKTSLLEALAYVLGAMSGVFFSKGLAQYALRSAIFVDVLVWGVLRIAGIGLVVLGLAAVVEASWAPMMVGWLF